MIQLKRSGNGRPYLTVDTGGSYVGGPPLKVARILAGGLLRRVADKLDGGGPDAW